MAYFSFKDKIGGEKAGHLSRRSEQLKGRGKERKKTLPVLLISSADYVNE